MKKILAILLVAITLVSFVGCLDTKVYDAKAKEFTKEGLVITLTEKFVETAVENYTVAFDSKEVAILALKEEFSLAEGFGDNTLEEYADLVRLANDSAQNISDVKDTEGIISFEHEAENKEENKTYRYFSAMYKGKDAFWLVQFACEESKYEEYKPYFIQWAKTVEV